MSFIALLLDFLVTVFLAILAFFWADERHLSVISWNRRRKRHPRHHQVAERRGCAGTGPLQRRVIHDIIKLLTRRGWGCAAAARHHPPRCQVAERRRWVWVGVVTRSRKTHIITFFGGRVLMFCYNHEAITTPSPLPGQAALRGESGCSPGSTAWAEFFCAFHFIVEPVGGCCCVSIIAGPGVTASWQDT